jgi:hypothetical protein
MAKRKRLELPPLVFGPIRRRPPCSRCCTKPPAQPALWRRFLSASFQDYSEIPSRSLTAGHWRCSDPLPRSASCRSSRTFCFRRLSSSACSIVVCRSCHVEAWGFSLWSTAASSRSLPSSTRPCSSRYWLPATKTRRPSCSLSALSSISFRCFSTMSCSCSIRASRRLERSGYSSSSCSASNRRRASSSLRRRFSFGSSPRPAE